MGAASKKLSVPPFIPIPPRPLFQLMLRLMFPCHVAVLLKCHHVENCASLEWWPIARQKCGENPVSSQKWDEQISHGGPTFVSLKEYLLMSGGVM